MTEELVFLLTVLRHYLHGQPTPAPDNVDYAALFRLAEAHQLTGIVYRQCKAFLPEKAAALFSRKEAVAISHYARRHRLLLELDAALTESGIPHFYFKGSAIAAFYPHPFLRTMGDSDILVPDAIDRAHTVATGLGFEKVTTYDDQEWGYKKDGLKFELHPTLLFDNFSPKPFVDFFSNVTPYIRDGELDHSFHFLYVLAHLHKHFIFSGVGFRQFFDLAVMMQYDPTLDFAWIEAQLRQLELFDFACHVFACCEAWFGTELPPAFVLPPDPAFLEEAAQKIGKDGVFGFRNEDNRNAHTALRLRGKRFQRLARIGMLVQMAFPSYREFLYTEAYGFVQGRPWLLPVAWVYRFYRVLFRRSKEDNTKAMQKLQISPEKVAARDALYTRWGL